MTVTTRILRIAALLIAFAVVGGGARALAQFNPQPDPPGFGLIPVEAGQTARLNVSCFPHQIGRFPPGPCRGEVEFHDAAGHELTRGAYNLRPGQVAMLEYSVPPVERDGAIGGSRVTVIPCIMPAPGGRAVPTVEVFDRSGRMTLFTNPAAARMTEFSNGKRNPGEIAGFNPQPDPPGFGAVTLGAGQMIRLNVVCFADDIGGIPPDPCRGSVMFHDAEGREIAGGTTYRLQPGESAVLEFAPAMIEGGARFTLTPCVMPSGRGRAVPSAAIADAMGRTTLLINPAAAQMSDFDR